MSAPLPDVALENGATTFELVGEIALAGLLSPLLLLAGGLIIFLSVAVFAYLSLGAAVDLATPQ